MVWKLQRAPAGTSDVAICHRVTDLQFQHVQTTIKDDPTFALFHRVEDDIDFFLLSPSAAQYSSLIGGAWGVVAGPGAHTWRLMVGEARAAKLLGVKVG